MRRITDRHSRRRVLRGAAFLAAGGLLAACGATQAPSAPTAAPAPAKPTEAPKPAAAEPTKPAAAAPAAATTAPAAAPTSAPAAAAPAASGQTVKLTKMAWGSALEKQNIEDGLRTFEKQTPGVTVEYIHVPQDYDAKLQTMLAGGTAPDVFKTTSGNYPDYVKKGALMDITDRLKADPVIGKPDYFIQPFESDRSVIQGRWYGIGSTAQIHMLYFRPDLLQAAGVEPPTTDPAKAWTWQQFQDAGRKLTKSDGGKVSQWGLYWPTGQANTIVLSNGAEWIGKQSRRYELDKPDAVAAIQAVADLAVKDKLSPLAADLQSLGMNPWQMLASGKVAIIGDGNWALLDIAKMGFKFGVAVPPMMKKPATWMGSSSTGIYKNTKYPDQAWLLFRFLNTDDYMLPLVRVGLWHPSHTTLLTPEGIKKWLNPEVHPPGYEKLVTEFMAKDGIYIPDVLGNLKASAQVSQALDPVWIGKKTAQEALADVVPKANKILDDEEKAP
jgi:multiple sugar transport system substrate-binding protein